MYIIKPKTPHAFLRVSSNPLQISGIAQTSFSRAAHENTLLHTFNNSVASPWRQKCRKVEQNTVRSSDAPRASSSTAECSSSEGIMTEMIEFLKEDLQHLFDDQGIDTSKYEDKVIFEDPMTRHTSLNGYLANIRFLRFVFDPTFNLLDIRQTGEWEITTRWSMDMRPTFVPPPARKFWEPRLSFTGTSVMQINPKTGKFISHIDTWDALDPDQQSFFSPPAFINVMEQVFDFKQIPQGLESPNYMLLWKKATYEVRKYDSMTVAEAPMTSGGMSAFRTLAGYIFGGNEERKKLNMTTPVLTSMDKQNGSMQFYLGNSVAPSAAPVPLSDANVTVKEIPGKVFAVKTFTGLGDDNSAKRVAAELRRDLQRDGLLVADDSKAILAQYNDPGTLPPFRRNEILLQLNDFKLW